MELSFLAIEDVHNKINQTGKLPSDGADTCMLFQLTGSIVGYLASLKVRG